MNIIKKHLISVILIIALIVAFLPIITSQVNAATNTAKDYSSEKAIEYAQNHWNDGKGDCIEFVRACLKAGGMPQETGRTYGYTPNAYMNYLVNNNYAVKYKLDLRAYYRSYMGVYMEDNEGKIAPGDVLLYHCNNKNCPKNDFHVSFVNGANSPAYPGFASIYAHNPAQNSKPAVQIDCSRCDAESETTTVYVLHIKSAENGYSVLDIKLAKPVVKAVSARKAVKLSWGAVENANGYKVYRATTKTGKYSLVKTVKNGNTLSYTNSGLKAAKRYYYKVKAYNNEGITIISSSYSTLKSAKTK